MRKVLSFVLVLSLVLGSFSMAFAATPTSGLSDIAGITNEEAIQVNYDLGIVTGNPDGTFLPEKAVNRAEFAAMITRALAIPDSALAGYTTTSFKDTTGYGWAVPYLAFCQSKGILLGDGAGNAMPGRTINTNEAVTIALRAIGYVANSSELVGVWPSNYVTKAQELGLYDDVAKVTNVDKANAAQIIYNTLTVQKVAVNSDGQTNSLWDNTAKTIPTTLLSSGLNCTSEKGVMGSDFGDDAIINVQKYTGQYGTAYLNSDDEVVAFISDCTGLVGTFKATADWKDAFNTTDADVDYSNNTTTAGIDYFNNGELVTSSAPTAAASTGTEYVLYADVSGKKINKIYSVMYWEVTEDDLVTAADLKDIDDDQSFMGVDFILDDDDEIDYNSFTLVGVASLDDIKADNVVYVYGDSDGIRKIEVGTATVEGVVKDFKGETKAFKIGDKSYKNAKEILNDLDNASNITDDEVGDTVKAYIDARGYIYSFDNIDDSANEVAYVEAKATTGIDRQVRLTLADGSSKVFSAKDSATFALLNEGTLISYGLNSKGEISNVSGTTTSGVAGSVTFSSVSVVKGLATTPNAVIASNVVVFTTDGIDDYGVTTIDKVNKNKEMTGNVQALFNKDGNKIIALLVDEDDAKASANDVYAVANDVYSTPNADGDKVQRAEGFANGASLNKLTDGTGYFVNGGLNPTYTSTTATFAGSIQLYKLELDANDVITKTTPVTDNGTDIDVVVATTLEDADGRNSVTDASDMYALASNVVVYEVNSDGDYKVFTGSFKQGDVVQLYNIDADDNDEYDIVILCRAGR
ncbi:S-layer homology domain-containing protein [Sinanaerobacter chloroacetimidivorans]|uniref:S-layer homology domain-containing protein n=1 Tax=Sinanaerobacter chloroacetimidivorans TaxID=2818044 RepID=A0A8J7W4N0_9FIRM|nr:S-layer homology domain-containing protein [Sinanaerobacter chloroacetimidivorans]MBR0600424.1 S-layer homology domain-containing protein [Sinanaerobacter chloroacetimidivorans]